MPPVHIKVAGVWKECDAVHIKVGGVWKKVDQAHIRTGGAWKETLISALSVIVAATKTIINFRVFTPPCIANVKVDSDGDLYRSDETGVYSSYETWLDAGSNTQVWVQRTIISGTLSTDAGSSRLACTSDRIFGVTVAGPNTGVKTCVIDLKFYDAASGGSLLDTQRVTLTANYDSGA